MCFKYAKFRIERVNPLSDWYYALGITNNRKVSGSVIRYFQPKMDFFYHTFFFFVYILTVNTSSHVPVLNFEEKNCVIQNAIIT
jgi:hypothetical protein